MVIQPRSTKSLRVAGGKFAGLMSESKETIAAFRKVEPERKELERLWAHRNDPKGLAAVAESSKA
jgi:hypothetical protein